MKLRWRFRTLTPRVLTRNYLRGGEFEKEGQMWSSIEGSYFLFPNASIRPHHWPPEKPQESRCLNQQPSHEAAARDVDRRPPAT